MKKLFQQWLFGSKKSTASLDNLSIVPKHIAIIMDGNGRWANRRGLPRSAGHRAGMERVLEAIDTCLEVGVKHLTLYAFSTENWRRPTEEVDFLMDLFNDTLKNEVLKIHQRGVKIRFIGLKQDLNPSLVKLMDGAETLTEDNQALMINIAINYGGRSELVAAMKGLGRAIQKGELAPEELTEAMVEQHLFTIGQPDPDLLIRPGGEYRISNFLIWQSAYAEFYFSDRFWPDFGRDQLLTAINYFSQRERRFGEIKKGDTV